MLVISRRPNEKFEFPGLGVSIEILRVAGRTVRVGIEAPPEIDVLRSEIAQRAAKDRTGGNESPLDRKARHTLRNQLNVVAVGLNLLQHQLEDGNSEKAEATLIKVLRQLEEVERVFPQQRQLETEATQTARPRALLVEDNANESGLLAEYLRLQRVDVDTVADGVQALDYLSSNSRPDVVLLDMKLPRLDGPSTLKQIRQNPIYRGLKVFAITGSNPDDLDVPTGPAGVDEWFFKPIDPRALVAGVNDVCEKCAC